MNVYVGPRHGWYGYRPYYRPSAYHCGYPYGYYPYWRRRYWRRLVLGTRASKAPQQLQRAIPELEWPFGFFCSALFR